MQHEIDNIVGVVFQSLEWSGIVLQGEGRAKVQICFKITWFSMNLKKKKVVKWAEF